MNIIYNPIPATAVWNVCVAPTSGPLTQPIVFQTEVVDRKELQRRKRISEWFRKARLRAEANFQMRLMEIEADAEANAWRPQVSSKDNRDFILSYHSLRCYGSDDGEKWRTYRNRYNKGWCGISISGISEFELAQVKKLLRKIRRPNYLFTAEKYDSGNKTIGAHEDICVAVWLRNLHDHNKLVERLEELRAQKKIMILTNHADIEEIEKLLKNVRHQIYYGDEQTALVYDTTIPKGLEIVIKMLA